MTRSLTHFTTRPLLLALCLGAATVGLSTALPAVAGADATIAPPPTFSSSSVLPDGRVYEQVSPANKSGHEAGNKGVGGRPEETYIIASSDGNGALFLTTGPMGEVVSNSLLAVAQRSVAGWATRSAIPRSLEENSVPPTEAGSVGIGISEDFSKVSFMSWTAFVAGQDFPSNFYLYARDGSLTWLAKPAIADPITSGHTDNSPVAHEGGEIELHEVGASPDFSTIYFTYNGTLTPEDDAPSSSFAGASRASIVAAGAAEERFPDFGFYEWHDGALRNAGVLPEQSPGERRIDPYGAVPAAFVQKVSAEEVRLNGECTNDSGNHHQVSANGLRAFFVSPTPGIGAPASDPPELYVRETASDGTQRSVLVSRSTVLPKVNGLPAPAPHGPIAVEGGKTCPRGASYMDASPDGSHVFFESSDRLTSAAPDDAAIKEYEFDLEDETLSYLPGFIVGSEGHALPLASSRDGSMLMLEQLSATGAPLELDIWSGGSLTTVEQLHENEGEAVFDPVRASSDGAVFVFRSAAPLAGFNNGGGGVQEVYRYEVGSNSLSCVSCPPAGVSPSGDADMLGNQATNSRNPLDGRGISADGARVFFDTPDPLVTRDTNGVRDVYEWENGVVSLISSGTGDSNSLMGDSSEDGGDVLFATADGLAPGDTDGGYDVYDARIPRPGDHPPPAQVPCQGEVCQGPPSVPQLLGAPASATFLGAGNLTPLLPKPVVRGKALLTRAQRLARALRACRHKAKRQRHLCRSQARRRFAPSPPAGKGSRGR